MTGLLNIGTEKLRHPSRLSDLKVKDIMETQFAKFTPWMPMEEAIEIFSQTGCLGGPVVTPQQFLVGVLSERDCLKMAMVSKYHNEDGGLVSRFMHKKVSSVNADMGLFDVVDRFIEHWFHVYPVTDGGRVTGVLTRKNVLKAVAKQEQTTW